MLWTFRSAPTSTSDLERDVAMGVIRGLQFAEPIVLLMMGMRSLEAFVIPVLVADRVASSLNISDYTNLERHPCLKNNTDSEALIQAKSAHWMMAYWLMSSLPGALTALLIGGWSDRVGRRLPIMLALLGFAASAGVTMIVAHWKLPLTVLIAGASIEGLLGGYPTVLLASYAHASDVSSSSKRTSRLIILNAMECVGSGSMQLIGGTMLKHHGVLLTECIVLGGHFLNLLYTGVFLASSTGPQQQQQTQTEVVVVVKPDNTTAQHLANSTEPQHLTNSTEPQDLINCTEPQQLDGSIEPQQQPQTEVMLAVKPDNPTIQQTPPAQVPIAYGPEGPDKISPISYLQSVWKTFALLLKPWKHRREFVLLLVVFQCLVFMFIGPNGLIVLYGMHQPLCWTSVMTGYFVSSRFAAMVISCLCLAPLIYWFKIPDRLVVQLSVFGMTGFFGAMALARHTSIMFIGEFFRIHPQISLSPTRCLSRRLL